MERSKLRFLVVISLFFAFAKTSDIFIAQEPDDVDVLLGASATLEFVINAVQVDFVNSVRWAIEFSDGRTRQVEESEEGRYTIGTEIDSGKFSLTIENVTEADGGKYTCIVAAFVDGDVLVITSRTATLTVLAQMLQAPGEDYPQCFGDGLTDGTFYEGEKATITCESRGGVPSAGLVWSLDGSGINGEYSNDSYARNINKFELDFSDNGKTFTCTATHPAFATPRTCQIGPLKILERPAPLCYSDAGDKLYLGESVTFSCQSTLIDTYDDLAWDFDGGTIANRDTASSAVSELKVDVENQLDGLSITCTSTNSGLPSSKTCLIGPLEVYAGPYSPLVTLQPTLAEVSIRQVAKFVCAAVAYPIDVTFAWFVDGQSINFTESVDFVTENDGSVLSVSKQQSGTFDLTCQAENSNGLSSSTAILVVIKELTTTEPNHLGQQGSTENGLGGSSENQQVLVIGASVGALVGILIIVAMGIFAVIRYHRLRTLKAERVKQRSRIRTPLRPRALLQAESIRSTGSISGKRPTSNGHTSDNTMQALDYDLFNVCDNDSGVDVTTEQPSDQKC